MTTKAQRLVPWATGAAAVLSLSVLGVTAFLVDFFGAHGYGSHRANLMLFTSIWSILVLVYGKFGPRFLSLTFSSIAAIVMEGTCVIFWCSGFFALLFPAIRAKYGYLCGSDSVCGSFVADEILALFNWGFFTFIGVMDLLAVRSSGQLSSMQHPSMQHPGSAV